jgi:hypothetical protein
MDDLPPPPTVAVCPAPQPPEDKKVTRFEIWTEYEKIAMHFNDLLIRLRTQALGGVAAVAVLTAVIARGDISVTLRWEVLVAAFGMLLFFWGAIYVLDTYYYNRLLEGAVDAIVELEESDEKGAPFRGLQMSTRIEKIVAEGKPSRKYTSWRVHLGRRVFYIMVAVPLVIGFWISVRGFRSAGVAPIADGVVMEEQTAKPVTNALVVIQPPGENPTMLTTDESGTFFTVLPIRRDNPLKPSIPYQIPVTVSATGYMTKTLASGARNSMWEQTFSS